MMLYTRMALMLLAVVCFVLDATRWPWKANLQSLGLALWALAIILG